MRNSLAASPSLPAIHFNSVHDSGHHKQAVHVLSCRWEHLEGWTRAKLVNWTPSRIQNSSSTLRYSTGSQVTCNWHSRETWLSAKLAKPLHATSQHACDQPGRGGLAARLTEEMTCVMCVLLLAFIHNSDWSANWNLTQPPGSNNYT